ncbi:hypothetical protein HanRHA438_Chr09g0385901 [Helianthus annuus]|nr:hypothetical protein HanIR_Chr09g0403361 [Helianthus annuus]KAJ0887010.1 hypothetical protein HanRHA438_Chr09g0385901 [Helianthus annuus]
MGLCVGYQHPIHQRVPCTPHNPHIFQKPITRPLIKCRFLQHLIIRHRSGPPDTHVRKHASRVHHPLNRYRVRRLLISLRMPLVKISGDTNLRSYDRYMSCVH